jgi:large subunit ribosomal protein L13
VDFLSYKTRSANAATVQKRWVVVDAESAVLGRLASQVAVIIRGKHKPDFTPHVDCGDNVIVINADKIKLTGNKLTDKVYTRYTGYPGGQRFATPRIWLQKFPERIIEHAVRGMLPKNRLGRRLFSNLYVYAGAEHPHAAQQPEVITLKPTHR